MYKLTDYQKSWENLAKINPFWSILTDKKNWSTKEFFNTGKKEINLLINILIYKYQLNINYNTALDFGCGAGRLTQAMCYYFDQVIGVDISQTMINLAKKYNKFEGKCQYLLNKKNNLNIFKDRSFSFIYSNKTLQHLNPSLAIRYIKEFIRLLKVGGILVFQMLSHPDFSFKGLIIRITPTVILNKIRKMEMNGIKKEFLLSKLSSFKEIEIIDIIEDATIKNGLFGKGWKSYFYIVKKII